MSTNRQAATAAIEAAGIVAVIRIKDPAKLQGVVDAISEGGIRALEVTMTVPGAIELIAALAPKMPPGFLLGAGTVARRRDGAQGHRRRRAVHRQPRVPARGHRGVSQPGRGGHARVLHADRDPRRLGRRRGHRQGLPGHRARTGYIKDVRAPLPHVKLMPTGGVTLDNAGDWITAGAVAVGVGSALTDAKAIEAGNFAVLRSNAERIVASVRAAREPR